MRPRRESSPSPFSHIILTGRVISTVDSCSLGPFRRRRAATCSTNPLLLSRPKENLSLQFLIKGNETSNGREITRSGKVEKKRGSHCTWLRFENRQISSSVEFACHLLTMRWAGRPARRSHALHFRRHRVTAIIRSQRRRRRRITSRAARRRPTAGRSGSGAAATTWENTTPAASRRLELLLLLQGSPMRVSRHRNYLTNKQAMAISMV